MFDKNKFIDFMISAAVLRFGDFVTKSGRNTPYFVNTGNYSMGSQLATLGSAYAESIKNTCGADYQALFGPAYKGIPLVATVSIALAQEHNIDKPFFFNRKEAKDHGEGGSLVGYTPKKGDNIIIVEDVITAGTALRESLSLLKDYGVTVKDMFISVDRCEKGKGSKTAVSEVQEEFGITVHPLITIKDIIAYLENDGQYGSYIDKMQAYMEQYCVFE